MNNIYIESIHINKLLHLSDFDIKVCDGDAGMKHLIITGANGSGKTTLLNAIEKQLETISKDENLYFLSYRDNIKIHEKALELAIRENDVQKIVFQRKAIDNNKKMIDALYGKIELSISNIQAIPNVIANREFVIAYYGDMRKPLFKEVENPEKPNLNYSSVKTSKVDEFIKYMVDLKVQRALANGENANDYAREIEVWFDGFQQILRNLFSDNELYLEFDYKTYKFYIHSLGKKFKFTQLSAGYSAALDIIVDLILKMQKMGAPTGKYAMPGIVMIDEVETHLHLKMQKEILPLLITLFPNIQFIVTTHSPFVLSSIENSMIYDLEKHKRYTNMSEYSYTGIMEDYYEINTYSDHIVNSICDIERLLKKDTLSEEEIKQIKQMYQSVNSLPEKMVVSPELRVKLKNLLLANMSKLHDIF